MYPKMTADVINPDAIRLSEQRRISSWMRRKDNTKIKITIQILNKLNN